MDNTHIIQFPEKLGNFIFSDLNAIFEPEFHYAKQNLNVDEKRVRKYLGTYFPRSFGSLVIRVTQPDKSCIQMIPIEVKIYALEQMFDV